MLTPDAVKVTAQELSHVTADISDDSNEADAKIYFRFVAANTYLESIKNVNGHM